MSVGDDQPAIQVCASYPDRREGSLIPTDGKDPSSGDRNRFMKTSELDRAS